MAELLACRVDPSEDDFYELLGCDENSTADQIATEFKQLARKYHPDKEQDPEQKNKAESMFVRLEAARTVLLDSEQRAMYDRWRSGGFKHVVSFKEWQGMQSRVHSSIHWAAPQKKAPSLPQPEAPPTNPPQGTDDTQSQSKRPKVDSSKDNEKLSPLEQFRKGTQGQSESSKLSQFRNYQF